MNSKTQTAYSYMYIKRRIFVKHGCVWNFHINLYEREHVYIHDQVWKREKYSHRGKTFFIHEVKMQTNTIL